LIASALRRELRILVRARGSVINPLAFLLLSTLLFLIAAPGLAEGDPDRPSTLSAGILWTLVLLTQLLALDSMYRRDFDSGVLEQTLINAQVPFVAVLIRILMQWLSTGFIIALCGPLLGMALGIAPKVLLITLLSMLLGTPALSLLGSVGASVTVGFNRGGIILALLVLPLFLPTLIFGADMINVAQLGGSVMPQAYALGLISLISLAIAPFATLAGLRISLEMQ
jgi:heme exporter protein B